VLEKKYGELGRNRENYEKLETDNEARNVWRRVRKRQ
jgi:hypothetical protein